MKKKASRRGASPARDQKKESVFKELSRLLGDAGYVVRREELKRGHGWKVVSGECKFREDSMIFVDRRLPQDDQINFLIAKVLKLRIPVTQAGTENLPEAVRSRLSPAAN